jgi:putative ATP-binding cassette transporter
MSDAPEKNAQPGLAETARAGAWAQSRMIFGAIFAPPLGRRIIVLMSVLIAAILATTYGQLALNEWNQPFYDAITRRDLHDFLYQLAVYFVIVGILLVLDVLQRWLNETAKFRLRENLTRDLLKLWMAPRRAFWLATGGNPMGVNPDQRMSEDALKVTDLSFDLSTGLFRSTVLLAGFAGVLWNISKNFTFRVGEVDYVIPGFMLWAALSYAVVGSLLSYWVGRSLVTRNADRYAREADLRFALVRINEHVDGIALADGESGELRRVETHVDNLMLAMRRLVRGLTNLTWVTAGFGWITGIAPILVAAPLYFTGKTSFGGMMMAAAAFTQAQGSLRWFVDNFSALADWRASLLRVANFRAALLATESSQAAGSRIEYAEGPPGQMAFEELQVESPVGREGFHERRVVIRAGEHTLICGAPGEGKTPLFRAISGLWPWGSGRIVRPRDESVMYVPRGTPYLPRGTLREVLAYPLMTDRFADGDYLEALERTGLGRYTASLDAQQRWDRELREDEQMALTLARVILRAPPWVVFDDTFSAMEDDTLERVVEMFMHEFKKTTVIHVGRSTQMHLPLFARVLHLRRVPSERSIEEHWVAERILRKAR